jgi:hypothetical protein
MTLRLNRDITVVLHSVHVLIENARNQSIPNSVMHHKDNTLRYNDKLGKVITVPYQSILSKTSQNSLPTGTASEVDVV